MSKFAKLFETEDYGQIVVIKQGSDDHEGDEIRFFFQPPNLGVCSMALTFEDSDEGYEKCDETFDKITEETAKAAIHKTYSAFS